jgi:adenylate cyclase
MCAAPFGGVRAPLMRLIGKRPSDKTPNLCNSCFAFMSSHRGGAEIDCTFLFADIRGSTTLAERISTAEFHAILNSFYDVAARVVFEDDGFVDKFVGDEVVAMFVPLLAGDQHAIRAVEAARALLQATGHADAGGPWVPVGAGVHTGPAWVGAVGEGHRVELTAVGDAVNTAARLASAATAGEVLISVNAGRAATLGDPIEQRYLELKGKEHAMGVVRLRVAPYR